MTDANRKKNVRWGMDEYAFGAEASSLLAGMPSGKMKVGGFYRKPILIVVAEGEPMEQYHIGAIGDLEVNGMRVKTVVAAIDGRHVTCQIVDDNYEGNSA